MGPGILPVQVMAVIGCYEFHTESPCKLNKLPVGSILVRDAVILYFQIETLLPEDIQVSPGSLFRPFSIPLQQVIGDLSVETGTQRYQAFTVAGEDFQINPRLVIEPFKKPAGYEFHEVPVACHVPGKQYKMIGVDPVRVLLLQVSASRGYVDLTADDRLQPCLQGGLVELYRTKEIAVICYGHGRHPVLDGLVHQFVYLDGPVKQAVFSMQVEGDKIGVFHT